MAFWGDKKSGKAEGQTPQLQSEALGQFGELEAKYASSARSRAVQKRDELIEYRRAEKMPNGKWKVIKVEIYDYSKLQESAAKTLDIESATPIEKKIAADVTPISVTGANGQEINEFSFIVAMSFLANLEYDVVKKNGGYVYADEGEMVEKAKFVKFDDKTAFSQKDFHDIEHFVTVSEREGIVWTEAAVPKLTKFGRLTEKGTYMVDDVERANAAFEAAAETSPADDAESRLAAAFQAVTNKQSVEATIKALDVIHAMDTLMQNFAHLSAEYTSFLEQPVSRNAFHRIRERIGDCESNCNRVNKDIDVYVDKYRDILLRVTLSANTAYIYAVIEDRKKNPENINNDIKELLIALQKENDEIAEECEISKNFENFAEAAIPPSFLKQLVESYNTNRAAWQKKIKARPEAALETKSTFADKRNTPNGFYKNAYNFKG